MAETGSGYISVQYLSVASTYEKFLFAEIARGATSNGRSKRRNKYRRRRDNR